MISFVSKFEKWVKKWHENKSQQNKTEQIKKKKRLTKNKRSNQRNMIIFSWTRVETERNEKKIFKWFQCSKYEVMCEIIWMNMNNVMQIIWNVYKYI